jgi:hypothetical protein
LLRPDLGKATGSTAVVATGPPACPTVPAVRWLNPAGAAALDRGTREAARCYWQAILAAAPPLRCFLPTVWWARRRGCARRSSWRRRFAGATSRSLTCCNMATRALERVVNLAVAAVWRSERNEGPTHGAGRRAHKVQYRVLLGLLGRRPANARKEKGDVLE